jgi:predicted enzyme related to lactoylglutathione lyase
MAAIVTGGRGSRRLRRSAVLAALLLAAAGAIGAAPQGGGAAGKPAVAPGAFVWHDLVTPDPAGSRAFYRALFNWTFEDGKGIDPGYTIIRHEGQQIGGIVPLRASGPEKPVAQWLAYVTVADVDRAAGAFRDAGGRVIRDPVNARKDLRVAVVSDPQGAPIGLASRGPLVNDAGVPGMHRWLWMDYVAARDTAAALTFYGSAVGFRNEVHETRDTFTYHLLSSDRPRAGLFLSPWTRDTSAWLPYVRVADPAAAAARVKELGGTVVVAPEPRVRNSSLAIVLDPSGAPLALQRYPYQSGATP